jgi:DNA repair photolyase
VLLRLPLEVGGLFEDWLAHHYPQRRERVMNRIRDCRGGRVNDSRFGARMRGEGVYAQLLRKRFEQAYRRHGFRAMPPLVCSLFSRPAGAGGQLDLFGGSEVCG